MELLPCPWQHCWVIGKYGKGSMGEDWLPFKPTSQCQGIAVLGGVRCMAHFGDPQQGPRGLLAVGGGLFLILAFGLVPKGALLLEQLC